MSKIGWRERVEKAFFRFHPLPWELKDGTLYDALGKTLPFVVIIIRKPRKSL